MCNTCVNEKELLNNKEEIKEYVNIQTGEKLDLERVSQLKDKSMLKHCPQLWCEWDFEKNDELGYDIWKLTYGSGRKAWWICSKNKTHNWNAQIYTRRDLYGCPYCSGRNASPEYNLLLINPEDCKEWDYQLNEFPPSNYTPKSAKEVWWKCLKCNSRYQMAISSKTSCESCPYCSKRRVNHTNSLASLNPELALQWHPTLNGDLTPNYVVDGSNIKVWWICKCGYEWKTSISDRRRGTNCSKCSYLKTSFEKSLYVKNNKLASEWHPTKNGDLNPYEISSYSQHKVWWIGTCGHEWEAKISIRSRGCGCPYCSNLKTLKGFNDLWTTHPHIAKLLVDTEIGYKYTYGSNLKTDWICENCGCITQNREIYRVSKDGLICPVCSDGRCFPEKIMYALLSKLNLKFSHDTPFRWSDNKRYDFYVPSLDMVIETHGIQHYDKGFSEMGGRTLEEEQVNDEYKYNLALKNGIKKYIVIDCKYSDFEFIKNNILNSELAELLDLTNIDWYDILNCTSNSLHLEILNMWNNGLKVAEILENTPLSATSINRVLNKFKKAGLLKLPFGKTKEDIDECKM